MPELMLKPGWPGSFRRTIQGKKPRTLVFDPNLPVEVTPAEMKLLAADIGLAVFEVERDEKNRPRFVESSAEQKTEQKSDVDPTDREYKQDAENV